MSAAPVALPSASAASAAFNKSFPSAPTAPLVMRSRNAVTWPSGNAPMKPSTGWPLENAITAGIDWMPIDVHLGELDLALGGLHRLFQDRRELLAGPAPRRPEIHQHRLVFGFLDHVFHESLRGRVLDHIGRCCRRRHRPAVLQHRVSPDPAIRGRTTRVPGALDGLSATVMQSSRRGRGTPGKTLDFRDM